MLTSEIIRQVRRIQVRTGRQVADVLAGEYVSVFKGRGMEFDEVRPYVPGDDVRTIDWNVTARHGAPFVKRYVEERQLTVMLLVDVSASMDFGSAHRSKREAATELSALIAFSAIQNDDKVGLLLFHHDVERYIPPRKGQKHALCVVREVLAHGRDEPGAEGVASPGGSGQGQGRTLRKLVGMLSSARARPRGTDIAGAVEFCRRVLPRRAVLFVVSDFLGEEFNSGSRLLSALRNLNRKHDVVAVRVCDRREAEPVDAGLLSLQDAETGRATIVDTSSPAWRAAAAQAATTRAEALRLAMMGSGIDLVTVDATASVVDPLVAFFHMRKRRQRR